jgi:hypothetical protein
MAERALADLAPWLEAIGCPPVAGPGVDEVALAG